MIKTDSGRRGQGPAEAARLDSTGGAGGRPRVRLEFLDGLRGLAALYVMLSHAFQIGVFDDVGGHWVTSLSPAFVRDTRGLTYGHYAVAVFIVLSGYCLMLPVARQGGDLVGGLRGYIRRRARRILPPYYAALALSLAALLLFHRYHHVADPVAHREWLANLSAGSIVSHLFLIQNLYGPWSDTIDGPMWSLAPEWQIYFIFPLLLLPVWRRFGASAAVAAGFALGLAPHWLLPPQHDLGCAWYLGLFTLGMAGASVSLAQTRPASWKMAALVLGAVFFLVILLFPEWLVAEADLYWLFDSLVGAMTICVIVYCAERSRDGSVRSHVLRYLEARWLVGVGAFSYSLYLVHYPILAKMDAVLRVLHWTHAEKLAALFLAGVPLALALAYLFHRAFERPFMPGRPTTARQAAKAAAVSPAP